MDYYLDKVKKFNQRIDYKIDVNIAKLLVNSILSQNRSKKIFVVGTGLGGDTKIVKNLNEFEIIGIEPRKSFQTNAKKIYDKFGGKLEKCSLGDFVKTSKKLSGIFLFVHSINHIPINELEEISRVIKQSYVIIINPNTELEKIAGKTDETVISYLNSKDINKILGGKIIFDFFYNQIIINEKSIFLREAILLKIN